LSNLFAIGKRSPKSKTNCNRGRSRLSIFRELDNYLFVMDKLQRYQREFNLAVIASCLLPNHYHFLVRQDGEHRASLLPQRIFNSYS